MTRSEGYQVASREDFLLEANTILEKINSTLCSNSESHGSELFRIELIKHFHNFRGGIIKT